MNEIHKKEHPKVSTGGFRQLVDMPGNQQLTEADIARAGEFQRKYPKLAEGGVQ